MHPLTLYGFFYSSASWRVRIALALKQLPHQKQFVNLSKGEQYSESYRKINAGCSVPSLVVGDKVLTESTAIIEYLDAVRPEPYKLLPIDPLEQAQVRAMSQVVNTSMQPLQNLRVAKKVADDFGADRVEWTLYWVHKGYLSLESMLEQHSGTYSYGDTITQADVFLYPQAVGNAERFGYDLTQHPNVNRVVNQLRQHEAFRLSEPKYQEDAPK